MKTINLFTILFICLVAISCNVVTNTEKEEEAIIAVIEEEKDAFFEGDLDKINGVWKQDSTSRKIYMSPDGSWVIKGWAELSKENEHNLREDRSDLSGIDALYTDYDVTIFGNTAMVYHDATFEGIYEGKEISRIQERVLHLVKVNGIWKIDQMVIHGVVENSKQLVPKGMVCCWNYTLNSDVQTEEFERFVLDEYIPAFEKHFAGIEMILVKGERGENINRYRIMLIMDSVDERNDWWPAEGETSEKNAAASEKMKDLSDRMRTMVASGTFTDWVIL